ncbi:phage major capsid protein [Rhodopseudomonas pseudopalustris]|uniref:Phage major capsid protein, HK97 family n=1 Tax=Rhodopseudomonas pseudopalustris TaxID=1513892 RepID=A0A1H8S3L9_9BRAD|nr:phage major capsid protein [Rhodopseudomonas pseudopalustris]SEO73260.1 phage major capsid protein, HK97 family [Rhodopseudomonas pseudopalustris]
MDYEIATTAPETKAGFAPADRDAHDELLRAHEEFKSANDERLAALERRRGDVLLEEKVDRISDAIDARLKRIEDFALKQARPQLDGRRVETIGASREHKSAFEAYIRSGDASPLRQIETKALSVGSNPDGGYLVPEELERSIAARLGAISPIRSLASVRQISGSVYKKPFMTAGPATGWVGETAARPQTSSPTLDALSFPAMELYAMPAATATLLDDAAVNLDDWLTGEIDTVFAEQEGAAFVSGDGINKPKGFLAAPTVANAAWSWGNLGFVATGAAGAFPASNPSDVLIDLMFALKPGYRQNASFVMNRRTQAAIRKFKDNNGVYLWQPPATASGRASLIGFPLADAEDMPDIAANSLAIAFGDFRRGYLIVDRQGVRVLRDPYSAKPYVLFYTTKRVGGGVQDFDAIKVLKFGGS